MRKISVDNMIEVFKYFEIPLLNDFLVADIGGTEEVYLKPRIGVIIKKPYRKTHY